MDKIKSLYTTGEAAEICNVSQQTIIRCFDSGRLQGFKIPGSKFRRIPRESLIKFMKDNSIPLNNLDSGKKKVLIVDDDPEILEHTLIRENWPGPLTGIFKKKKEHIVCRI